MRTNNGDGKSSALLFDGTVAQQADQLCSFRVVAVASRKNTLTPILMDHLGRLSELAYLSFLHQSMTDKTVDGYQDALDNWDTRLQPKPTLVFGLSSVLPVRVVIGKPRDIYPVKGHGAGDKEHMAILAELDQRIQAQLLALAFETVESFFRTFMGKLYFLTRAEKSGGLITLTHRRREFRAFLGAKSKLHNGTPQYYQAYSQWYARRSCDDLMKDLRRGCQRFDELGRKNNSRTNLFDFYRTLGFCRHRAVHSAGVVDEKELNRLPPEWVALLRDKVIKDSRITHLPTLLPKHAFVRWAVGRCASFIELAYQVASEDLNLAIDLNV